nr:hypothetical protein [Apium graveolens]
MFPDARRCIFPMVVRCHLSPSVDQFPTPPPSSRSQAQSPGSGTFLDRQQSKKERTMATWPTNKPFTVALLPLEPHSLPSSQNNKYSGYNESDIDLSESYDSKSEVKRSKTTILKHKN